MIFRDLMRSAAMKNASIAIMEPPGNSGALNWGARAYAVSNGHSANYVDFFIVYAIIINVYNYIVFPNRKIGNFCDVILALYFCEGYIAV